MAVERLPGAIGVMFGIQMQHDACDVAPVGILRIRVEQAQICDDVFLVVSGQHRIGGAVSATSGLSGGFCMGVLATVYRRSTLLWLLGILMTAKPSPHSHIGHCRTCARRKCQVRFASMSRHRQPAPACPFGANNRHQLGWASRQNTLAVPPIRRRVSLGWIACHGARAASPD
jgi:hypothetical protein